MDDLADRYAHFPGGFFDRADPSPDPWFYTQPRMVHHLDDGAVAAVGDLYDKLGATGHVLDLMSSWVSHFPTPPDRLVLLGMNREELAANPAANGAVVADLNDQPTLPFADASFDAAVCTASVDYLTRPLHVFAELARVMRIGGRAIITFSNRCFPTKAIRGWLVADDHQRAAVVGMYFHLTPGWGEPTIVDAPTTGIDPLLAVWAERVPDQPNRGNS